MQKAILDFDRANRLSELFKVFGDGTRLKILFALTEKEMCVCAIGESLHMSSSAISHQLSVLKQANLIDCRREGKVVYYYLTDNHVRSIIGQAYEHIGESK